MNNGYIKDGFFYHSCGNKLFRIAPNAVIVNHIAYCTKCKAEIKVTILDSKLLKSEPYSERKSS